MYEIAQFVKVRVFPSVLWQDGLITFGPMDGDGGIAFYSVLIESGTHRTDRACVAEHDIRD